MARTKAIKKKGAYQEAPDNRTSYLLDVMIAYEKEHYGKCTFRKKSELKVSNTASKFKRRKGTPGLRSRLKTSMNHLCSLLSDCSVAEIGADRSLTAQQLLVAKLELGMVQVHV